MSMGSCGFYFLGGIMIKQTVLGALHIAIGVTLPTLFHMLGAAGSIFLPMHIPVLIAGCLLGKRVGLLVGILTPLLSSLFTGMPPLTILPVMLPELATYGLTMGYFYHNKNKNIFISLFITMLLGRFVAVISAFFAIAILQLKLSPLYYITGAIITGLPGIALQFVLIPTIIKQLEKQFYSFLRKN